MGPLNEPGLADNALNGKRVAYVDDIGLVGLAFVEIDLAELLGARPAGVEVVDLEAVLGAEVLHDRAVVCPRRWVGCEVDGALGFGRGDEGAHAAARVDVDCHSPARLRRCRARGAGTASKDPESRKRRSSCTCRGGFTPPLYRPSVHPASCGFASRPGGPLMSRQRD